MKSLLKRLFVPALASRPVSAVAARVFGQGIPIFMVHRMVAQGQSLTGITPDHLRRCLRYLQKSGHTFVSLEEIILALKNKTPLPGKSVVFTMDDGFSDQARIAAPIFHEFDCPLTFFIITGLIDQAMWPWDAKVSWIVDNSKKTMLNIEFSDESLTVKLGDDRKCRLARQTLRDVIKEMDAELVPDILNRLALAADVTIPDVIPAIYQPLTWDTARELEANGVRFAPHSMTHRILSKLGRASVEQEIRGSWETLQRELANPLKVFCYPTGRVLDFGPREIGLLKNEGFLGATATAPGFIEPGKSRDDLIYRLPRFALPENMTDLIQHCSWIEHARYRRAFH
ncbi:MAG: polysaccharide deacetylase family protein [Gammaproteobacteria bacterium]|nr:polysaccharide deacetylase family protein [Gammaproteobacteria bacterium]